jgi:protein phosphatase
MRLRVGAGTDKGRVRPLNEDAFALSTRQGLFMVCDGMGGALAGEVASRMAADIILDRLNAAAGDNEDDVEHANGSGYLPRTDRLAAAVRRSNEMIYARGKSDARCAEMGTTVVSAWLNQSIASVAHVGDSRAYLWRNNELELLTCDHSLLEAQIRAGLAERHCAEATADGNVLVRVVGGEPDVDVDLTEVPVQPGDYLLLCSDGLTRMVPDAALAAAIGELRHPQRICDHLIDTANRNGGADNITVIVVEVVGSWWRRLQSRLS